MDFLRKIKLFFTPMTNNELIDKYLSESTDLVELENRMRKIDRGEAPFQRHSVILYK